MTRIPDITETEAWIIKTTLKERYGEAPGIQFADAEVRLSPADRGLTECPVIVWEADDCHFVIFKSAERRYRCQFYYRGYQQYGTGVHEYDDLTECAVSLLQAQADHAAQDRGDIVSQRR